MGRLITVLVVMICTLMSFASRAYTDTIPFYNMLYDEHYKVSLDITITLSKDKAKASDRIIVFITHGEIMFNLTDSPLEGLEVFSLKQMQAISLTSEQALKFKAKKVEPGYDTYIRAVYLDEFPFTGGRKPEESKTD